MKYFTRPRRKTYCASYLSDWYCSHPCVQKLPITNNEGEDDDIDHIFEYSKAVIYRGLYDLVHRDVLRENDGQAMVSLWKNHMVDFNNNGHNKYLINGHMLLTG